VHGNPINNTDPTGMFASIMEANLGLALATILSGYGVYNANANLLRSSAGTAGNIAGNAASSLTWQMKLILSYQAIRSFIITEDSEGKTFIPIVFYGETAKNGPFKSITKTTEHVRDSIFSGRPFVLAANGKPKTTWYNITETCNGKAKKAYKNANSFKGNPKHGNCDEYPFFSTEQGGPENYPKIVSLRIVPIEEASPQGSLMNINTKNVGVIPGDNDKKYYGVVPIPLMPVSFWRTPDGKMIF
jgi:hypothetical protein